MQLMQSFGTKRIWYGLGLLALDGIVFGMTNAGRVASFMMIIGFGLLLMTLYALIYGLVHLIGIYGLNLKRKRRVAVYGSLLVGGLLALQSINELSRRDIMVWLPLIVIGYLYSNYLRANSRNLEN